MSIHPGVWQKNAGAAAKYFEDLTTELVSGREPGQWGPGAKLLGLEGPVSLADFKALAYGKHPRTGQNITARQKTNRRAVLEVVASCPKSFSVAAVLGKDERLVALFERSVAETPQEADRFAAVRVRSTGRDEDAPARGLVFAQFIGVDRTGIVMALLGEVLGVPRELLVRDYVASGGVLHGHSLSKFLEGIDGHGGTAALLKNGGLEVATISALRDRLLLTQSRNGES